MNSFGLNLYSGRINILFEDASLREPIETIFCAMGEQCRVKNLLFPDTTVRVYGFGPYCLVQNDHLYCNHVNDVLLALDSVIENQIRSYRKDGLCSIHASSCLADGKSFVFVGISGSGKTSLSIALTQQSSGLYLGDEYAYIDYKKALVFHEPMPIRLKESNPLLIRHTNKGLMTRDFVNGQNVFYLSPNDLNIELSPGKHAIDFLIFPKYQKSSLDTQVASLSLEELSNRLMPSLAHTKLSRYELFIKILKLIAEYKIKLITLTFNDSSCASRDLLDFTNTF